MAIVNSFSDGFSDREHAHTRNKLSRYHEWTIENSLIVHGTRHIRHDATSDRVFPAQNDIEKKIKQSGIARIDEQSREFVDNFGSFTRETTSPTMRFSLHHGISVKIESRRIHRFFHVPIELRHGKRKTIEFGNDKKYNRTFSNRK